MTNDWPMVHPFAIVKQNSQVLITLGIQYGLTHTEVIVTSNQGPVLVKVNCRQHNMDLHPLPWPVSDTMCST